MKTVDFLFAGLIIFFSLFSSQLTLASTNYCKSDNGKRPISELGAKISVSLNISPAELYDFFRKEKALNVEPQYMTGMIHIKNGAAMLEHNEMRYIGLWGPNKSNFTSHSYRVRVKPTAKDVVYWQFHSNTNVGDCRVSVNEGNWKSRKPIEFKLKYLTGWTHLTGVDDKYWVSCYPENKPTAKMTLCDLEQTLGKLGTIKMANTQESFQDDLDNNDESSQVSQ